MKPKNEAEAILTTLLEQRERRVERGFYWENQIAFVYNSERLEGNPLTAEQTRSIFETRTIGGDVIPVDSIDETRSHFKMFDLMLNTISEPLSADLMKELHAVLIHGTCNENNMGLTNEARSKSGWKTIPNAVGNIVTVSPKDVDRHINKLLEAYRSKPRKEYKDITNFHALFEQIHPFQDGNGRVGRVLMFRECLVNNLVPFIVLDKDKKEYYRALDEFNMNPKRLLDFSLEMRKLYLKEFTSLVPEYYLLPPMQKYIQDPTIENSYSDSLKQKGSMSEKKDNNFNTGGILKRVFDYFRGRNHQDKASESLDNDLQENTDNVSLGIREHTIISQKLTENLHDVVDMSTACKNLNHQTLTGKNRDEDY